jgi:hypothetical protein
MNRGAREYSGEDPANRISKSEQCHHPPPPAKILDWKQPSIHFENREFDGKHGGDVDNSRHGPH